MIISFDDSDTKTSSMHLVRVYRHLRWLSDNRNQGVDLGKLEEVHILYKEDSISTQLTTGRHSWCDKSRRCSQRSWRDSQEAASLSAVGSRDHVRICLRLRRTSFLCLFNLMVAFAFGARWIDTPIAFILGIILGLLQLVVAKHSSLYSNVFEISASIILAFLARAFGSIPPRGLFCFSSLTASSIALILPGYIVCMSLFWRGSWCSDGISWIAVEEYCFW